jgi:hypothetical protein
LPFEKSHVLAPQIASIEKIEPNEGDYVATVVFIQGYLEELALKPVVEQET